MLSVASESLVKASELVKIVQCPVCLEMPLPPILTCHNGHIICSNCKPKLTCCPICKAQYTNIRSLAVEGIVEASNMKCFYSAEGCNKIISGKDLKMHLNICDYRPIICNESGTVPCKEERIDFGSYLQHLKEVHKTEGSDDFSGSYTRRSGCNTFMIGDMDGNYNYQMYNGRIFLRKAILRSGIIHWWISLVGSESDAATYTAVLTLQKNSDFRSMKLKITMPVHSIRSTVDEIIKKREVASLPVVNMLPFCTISSEDDGNVNTYSWAVTVDIQKE